MQKRNRFLRYLLILFHLHHDCHIFIQIIRRKFPLKTGYKRLERYHQLSYFSASLFQVETAPLRFIHARIHVDLTGDAHVVAVQVGKTMGDPLEYF